MLRKHVIYLTENNLNQAKKKEWMTYDILTFMIESRQHRRIIQQTTQISNTKQKWLQETCLEIEIPQKPDTFQLHKKN